MSNEKRVYSLLKSEKISVGRGEDGTNLCSSHIMKTKKFTISIHPISE